ncbi:hypothetical protein ADUPG1_009443 [Aduncisulcus paluster]|uniref:Uncharacterized protein n=1 Tax=Aduncisulcus paluster TaxID=2918883 RepID=A0ABQ5KVK2_9EUKA|nr:hypothetical protein ADUPG1_009443 [Aduncisulcus paluster]
MYQSPYSSRDSRRNPRLSRPSSARSSREEDETGLLVGLTGVATGKYGEKSSGRGKVASSATSKRLSTTQQPWRKIRTQRPPSARASRKEGSSIPLLGSSSGSSKYGGMSVTRGDDISRYKQSIPSTSSHRIGSSASSALPISSYKPGSRPPYAAAPSVGGMAPEQISQEYIYTLQQQCYFLELEGRMLREKLAEPGPRVKNKSIEANPATDPNLSSAAPLEEHIQQLRYKYVEMEDMLTKKFNQKEEELRRTQTDLTASNSRNAALTEALKHKAEEMERLKKECEEDVKKSLIEAEGAHRMVEEKDRLLSNALTDLDDSKTREKEERDNGNELQRVIASLRVDIKEARQGLLSKAAADRREKAIAEMTVTIDELREQLKEGTEHVSEVEDQLKKLSDAKWELETQVQHLLATERTQKREIDGLKSDLKQLREELVLGKRATAEALAQKDSALLKAQRLETEKSARAHDERVNAALAQRRLTEARELLAENKQTISDLKTDLDAARQEKIEAIAERESLHRLVEERVSSYAQQDDCTSKALGELRTVQQELDKQREKNETLVGSNEDLNRKIEAREARIAVLEEKLKIMGDINALKLESFETLKQTNLSLAEKIEGLSERYRQVGDLSRHRGVDEEVDVIPAHIRSQSESEAGNEASIRDSMSVHERKMDREELEEQEADEAKSKSGGDEFAELSKSESENGHIHRGEMDSEH